MHSKQDVIREHFNVETYEEANAIYFERLDTMRKEEMLPATHKDSSCSSHSKIQFPYEAPSHPPLPSRDEIKEKWLEWWDTHSSKRGRCFRLGAFMIKAGRDASIFQEAETLLFLQANSQVRTPTLYAAFTQPIKEWTMDFMVMEHLEGQTLSAEKWLSLGDKARSTILSRLCEQLQLLRSIPSEGYYGRLHRQGWSPMLNFLRKMEPGMAGPFDTYEEFVAALCSSARLTTAMGCCLKDFDARESYWLPQMESTLLACNGRQPVFTHMDPSIWNTIIRPIPGRQGEEDWEVTLIDWEYTGWFPAWLQTWSFIDKLIMITTDHTLKSEETRQYIGHVVKNLGEDYTEQADLFRNLAEHIDYGLL